MKPDLFWVPGPWPGRLAVVARPRGADWLEDEAAGWRSAGLDVIVSLLEKVEAVEMDLVREGEAAASNGIEFIEFPIPDRGVPSSTQAALILLGRLVDALEAGKSIAIHCRQGIGRSGLIAAGVLVASGTRTEQAVEVVSAARGQAIPETVDQLRWLQNLPSERLAVT